MSEFEMITDKGVKVICTLVIIWFIVMILLAMFTPINVFNFGGS